jgi:hypothetical protein
MTSITTSLSLRSNLRVSGAIAPYTVLGISPQFVADFVEEEYVRNAGGSTFANAITHTRASTATMVDSDGVLKWGPHNLHAHSDSPADWVVKQQITVSGNTLTATSTTAAHRIYDLSISSPSGASYIHNFEVSAGTHSYVQIHDGSSADYWANFDLSNGTVTVQTGSTASITQSGDKYICSMAFTSAVGSLLPILAIIPAANSTRNPSWTPVGTETVVLHRAWVYRSDLGGMVDNPERGDSYVPTTASAVYMPRVGHHVWNGTAWVNEGLLHESEARTNLVPLSVPSTSGWATPSTVLTTNEIASPTGAVDGSKVVANTSNAEHYIEETFSVTSGSVYTFSVFLKKLGYSNVAFRIPAVGFTDNAYLNVNMDAGTVAYGGGTIDAFGIENAGNGWFRVYMTRTASANATALFRVQPNTTSAYVGDDVSGVYVWGAQAEVGPTVSSHIPTSGSTVTRSADVLTIPSANLPWPSPEYIGPELVTNGTFDSDISGWTTVLGSASWSAGQISVARGGGGLGRVSAPITCEIGKVYRFTGYQDKGTTGSVAVTLAISSTSTVGAIAIFSSVTAGTFDLVFVATQTTHWVLLQNGSGSDGDAARSTTSPCARSTPSPCQSRWMGG